VAAGEDVRMETGPVSASDARRSVSGGRGSRLHLSTIVVLLVGVGLTIGLSLSARAVHNNNEDRLLHERVQEAGVLISGALPSLETPLASAAEVAEATNADPASFKQVMGPLVGPKGQYASASIWPVGAQSPKPIVVLGERPELESKSASEINALLNQAVKAPQLAVTGLLDAPQPRLAYAFSSQHRPVRFVAYTESNLPKNRKSRVIQGNAAFAGLGYALYLGSSESPQTLLASSATSLPIRGRRSAVTVPFGDNKIRIVMTPVEELGGTLLAKLQWLLLGFGLVLTVGAAALTERLVRRREQAQHLADELGEVADENARLYAEQRSVAQTLQHSLLPETLPETPELTVRARYIAGVAEIDIGGDWYDVIEVDNGNILFVVGDVSGRGLPAATIMASLRYAIRAYAAQGDDPATILGKLGQLISVGADGHFATVLCGVIDVARHQVTLANAAHPQPLIIDGTTASFLVTNVGVPIGVEHPGPYASVTVTIPPAATLLAFTDGLVERRGEILDVGLSRLRDAASRAYPSVDHLLDELAENLASDGPSDDIAILGIKWKT
jgi:serine phosphatase RsbU (regulator of sigma subunit)